MPPIPGKASKALDASMLDDWNEDDCWDEEKDADCWDDANCWLDENDDALWEVDLTDEDDCADD